ncbi:MULTISPECIES: SCP2 sterol-binding domain-containing protein [unclassified Archaeoglobus]|jgi:putative sterol carrier protein|uniref:SCP2 sterol-binding domain-containing protein n=1 Tax=unclassified Archaeoglobus TaxID=2643606 RepID=UPI0025B8B5C9|nr:MULTISPECIES: SCP2 sterol-binding domain-containing protein [unclassified Archaeoglobus]
MAVVYPSKEWMEELYKKVNSDEEYKKVAANWEGDYLCVVELDEEALKDFQNPKILKGFLEMLDSIPKEKRERFKGTVNEGLLIALGLSVDMDISSVNVDELAKKIAEMDPKVVLDAAKGASLNLWMDFWHGELRNIEVAAPGEHEDAKFKLIGPYSVFKQLVMGKADAITLVVSGKLKLQGDMGYMMRNMAAVRKFTELMASIPIES